MAHAQKTADVQYYPSSEVNSSTEKKNIGNHHSWSTSTSKIRRVDRPRLEANAEPKL